MLFSEAHHRQVVATSTASTVGRVEGFVVAPGPGRITALRLGKVAGHGDLLSWSDLRSFGEDAVTVASAAEVRVPEGAEEERAAGKDLELVGKLVLDEFGDGCGVVADVDFDPATGKIRALLTDRGELPGADLIGLGSYAAVVAGPAGAPGSRVTYSG